MSLVETKIALPDTWNVRLRYQLADRQDLADGTGVYPIDPWRSPAISPERAPGALGISVAVFAVTQHL